MSNQPTIPINTYCYLTIFVCHYDSLAAAKERYQERLFTTTRCGYDIVFASEQVLDLGHVDYMFESLLSELIGFDEPPSEAEKKNYSTFALTTIVNIPERSESGIDDLWFYVMNLLELDYVHEFPAVFPSHTRLIHMTPLGYEDPECEDV